MSSISSVGNSSLAQWLQQLSGNQQSSTTSSTNSTTTTSAIQDPFQFLADGTLASGQHHHKNGDGGGFMQKIESAVTTALQNAPAGSDPNTVIKDAISKVLQGGTASSSSSASTLANSTSSSDTTLTTSGSSGGFASFLQLLQSYGVAPKQFQQDMQAELAANGSSNSTTSTSPTAASNAAFAQLLQSYGVSSQQFDQDLTSALSSSQSSGQSPDFATLFKNFPKGTFLQAVG